MSLRIMTNITAVFAARQLGLNSSSLNKSMEKLSSGYRINSASDDAAGLAISERLRSQISGIEQSRKNVMDGISLVQTAEGALEEFGSIVQRMRILAVQAANGTLTTSDRVLIQSEITQLSAEIGRMASSVTFNGIELLSGNKTTGAGSITLQVGAAKGHTIVMNIGSFTNKTITDKVNASDIDGFVNSFTVQAGASSAISILDSIIADVNSQRAELGAVQNRLMRTHNFLGIQSENLMASESRIRDVDFAAEMTEFTKNQILVQAGAAMLSQANLLPQAVLQLF